MMIDRATVIDKGFKRGSVIDLALLLQKTKFPEPVVEWVGDGLENSYAIITLYDCALVHHSLETEPWSSVNNCTREPFLHSPLQDTSQVERPLDPLIELEIKRLSVEYDLEDNFRSELMRGKWLILEKNKSIKLHLGAELANGKRQPDNLVYRNDVDLDLSWLGEPEPDELILLTDDDESYIQPDLAWF